MAALRRPRGPAALLAAGLLLLAPWGAAGERDPAGAAGELVQRVMGAHAGSFLLEVIAKDANGREVMGVGQRDGKVLLQGSGSVALASALNWYLNDFLNTTYDWSTYEVVLPEILPLPPLAQTRSRVVQFSYYANVCTYGYSLAFVDWAYWEKHIDWLAMQGVNLPLAFVGQEKVLELTFARFNISFEDMQQFISGPAFLPWNRMGNMQAWGGPITRNWVESQAALQTKILLRMRGLGMTPVLPAFAGFLPPAFPAKHPDVKVSRSDRWGGFPDPYGAVYLVDPTDPMFQAIGAAFVQEQAKLFGTDHIYQCDTFNEMQPPSTDPAYLAASSKAVLAAMQAGDPKAIWLMQGWLFQDTAFWLPERIQAYVGAVPDDKMWILDLSAEASPIWARTQSFFGKPFIWNTLHNFGGQQGLTGPMPSVQNNFANATAHASSLGGVGITMEGIWTNYIIYDYTLSQAWGRGGEPRAWAQSFGARRYGAAASEEAAAVWGSLYDLAYASGGGPRSGPITTRPALPTQQRAPPAHLALQAARCTGTTWALEADGYYLAGYPPGFDPSRMPYANTLEAAQGWCAGQPACSGITRSGGRYEARAGDALTASGSGESSWLKLCSSPPAMVGVWRSLLDLAPKVGNIKAFRFDLVDVGREAVTEAFSQQLAWLYNYVALKDVASAQAQAQTLLGIIDDFDRLLSTDENFMLGRWLAWARAWSATADEQRWLEFNARNQLTLWGPTGQINDYATKAWGGLVRAYFRPRWALFLQRLVEALQAGKPFDQSAFVTEVLNTVEIPWQNATDTFPSVPEADAVEVSTALLQKYGGGGGAPGSRHPLLVSI